MIKSRAEQEQEIKTYVQPYADPDCEDRYGRGRSHWKEYSGDVRLREYEICECALINIKKEKDKQVSVN